MDPHIWTHIWARCRAKHGLILGSYWTPKIPNIRFFFFQVREQRRKCHWTLPPGSACRDATTTEQNQLEVAELVARAANVEEGQAEPAALAASESLAGFDVAAVSGAASLSSTSRTVAGFDVAAVTGDWVFKTIGPHVKKDGSGYWYNDRLGEVSRVRPY
jgi:hypothetical protein